MEARQGWDPCIRRCRLQRPIRRVLQKVDRRTLLAAERPVGLARKLPRLYSMFAPALELSASQPKRSALK